MAKYTDEQTLSEIRQLGLPNIELHCSHAHPIRWDYLLDQFQNIW